MKKQVLLFNFLLLSLATGITGFAKTVDENTAKTVGANYLLSNGIPGVKSSADLATVYVASANINGQTVVDYYVFNFTGSKGFVMVSGDDNIIPILAYSFESYFDISNMAPATKAWIEGYQNQITYVLEHNLPAKTGTPEKWNNLKVATTVTKSAERTTSTFPSSTVFLCNTTWDQAPGYNNDCPNGTGGRAVTGCVATAMAQVMKFWNWPTVGSGSHTYTQNPDPNGYPTQTADFGNTAYNWTEMNLHLAASCNATDTLMFHAGVSVEMNYDPNGSGSFVTESEAYGSVNCAEYALKTYFHYKRSLHGVLRDGTSTLYTAYLIPTQALYAESAWIALLEGELNAGRPILYKGNESSGEGHCWVCDGYNASGSFHFNWGWSGESDGYYTVDGLAPPALGTGAGTGNFNDDQGVIIGIQPDTYPTITSGNMELAAHVNCATTSALPYYSPFSIVTKITNTGTTSFSGSFCAEVFDTLNNYVCTIQTLTGQTLAAGATSAALTFATTSGFLAMIPGQYFIRIMYEPSTATSWISVANNGTFINFNELDIRHTSGMELFAPIDVTTGTTLLSDNNGTVTLNTKVANFQGSTFTGTISAILQNVSTLASFTIQQFTGQSIAYGYEEPYTFTNTSVHIPPGTYVLAIEHQPGGTGSSFLTGSDYYENPVIVTVNKNVGINTPASVADQISVYPNPANDVINIAAQGITINALRIIDIQGREIMKMSPDNNQSLITVPVNNIAAGVYVVELQTATELVTKKIVIAK